MSVLVEISTKDSSKIVVTAPFRFKDLIKGLPGSKYSTKATEWTVPLSWQACLALRGTFRDNMTIGPELTKWANNLRTNVINPSMDLRSKIEADLPGYDELYPHQRAGVLFLSTAERALLTDEMGIGKTRTTLSTLKYMSDQGKDAFPALIVCPNSTKIGWQRELEVVAPGVPVTIIQGSSVQRKKQFKEFKENGGALIINWEGLKSHSRIAPFGSHAIKKCTECGGEDPKVKESSCQAHHKDLNEIEFNTVIADEAHRMKSASAIQTRALKAATGDAQYRYALTGTPIANAPDDLWSILNWLMPYAYPSKTKYIDRFLSVSYNNWGAATVIGVRPEMETEFFAGLDPILRRMTKEVVLPFLPPKIYERRDVDMSPKQKKAYEQMRDQMVAMVDGEFLIALSPLTRMTRLLQFASSYAEVETIQVVNKDTGILEDKQKVTLSDPSSTLDAFMDDLDGFGDEQLVIYHPSKQFLNLLAARFEKLKIPYGKITGDEDGVERQRHMDNFQNKKLQYIMLNSAGGTGTNLNSARIMVFLGRPWSNVESSQAEDRVHRINSEVHESVLYIDYVTIGTVQSVVFAALGEKKHQLQTILRDATLMLQVMTENEVTIEDEEYVRN